MPQPTEDAAMAMNNSTAVRCGGIQENSQIMSVLQTRGNVLELTQQAEDAVLKPVDCGAWSHCLRAALATRIATHNDLPELAAHYASLISDEACKSIADTGNDGSAQNLSQVLAFMDSVALNPRDVVETDINTLQAHGVSDADIVRLTELNAFLAYQVRLIAGLTLLRGVDA